jgi:hypothetical protein
MLKSAVEGVITPSRLCDVARLEPEALRHSGSDREFVRHADGEGIGVYAFNVCIELLGQIPPDAADATAKIHEFGFRTWTQSLRQKLDIVDSGLG